MLNGGRGPTLVPSLVPRPPPIEGDYYETPNTFTAVRSRRLYQC